MEKTSAYEEIRNKRVNNFGLAGRLLNNNAVDKLPLKEGHNYTREEVWKLGVENLIKNAQTIEDLNAIGVKFNEAIDNNYSVDIWGYQLQAAKKMTQIYNQLGM